MAVTIQTIFTNKNKSRNIQILTPVFDAKKKNFFDEKDALTHYTKRRQKNGSDLFVLIFPHIFWK